MESRIGKTIEHKTQALDYKFSSRSSEKALLPGPTAQYKLMPSPSKRYPNIRDSGASSVIAKMIKLGESVDNFSKGIREHVKLSPKLSETVKGKLTLGARILRFGGIDKVFEQKFNINNNNNGKDERLLNASQCYLWTTAGPIAGLLFVSNRRIAFCSERCIKVSSATGKLVKVHYKVMVPLRKIERADEGTSAKKTTPCKYVQIVTEDDFELWFMGFLNHKKTLKCLQMAIHQGR